MTNFRSLLRKVLPLRASVFEAYWKKESKKFDEIVEALEAERSELLKLASRAEAIEKDLGLLKRQTLHQYNNWVSYSRGYDFERTRLPEEREQELRRWYSDKTKKELSLSSPRTYNEKIQWLKINGPLEEMGRLADKYLVRDYVAKRIGAEYLVPLLGVWDNPDEIDFEVLPERFVLKATHGSGWNIVVKKKSDIDVPSVLEKLRRWLGTSFAFSYGFELHYLYTQPRIIAEQCLENILRDEERDLFDYKFWCFGGRVAYIQFVENRARGPKMAFYDRSWVRQSFVFDHPRCERDIPKPGNLSEMIVLAEKLAEGFAHVRVDFYRLDDGTIYFGEMTFTSMSGVCRWDPPETDQMMGDLLKLPEHVDSGNQSAAMDDTNF